MAFAGALAVAAVLAWGLSATVGEVPWQAIAYGRRVAPILARPEPCQRFPDHSSVRGEGINSSVVITQRGDQKFFLRQR